MDNNTLQTMDVNILVSIINLKLRDYYSNVDYLCDDMNLDKELLIQALSKGNYEYMPNINQFK